MGSPTGSTAHAKLTNRTPSYRRHKATGQAIVTISGREYNRHRRYLQRDRLPLATGQSSVTVVEVIAAYWRYVKQTYTRDSWYSYKRALSYVKALYADTPAAEFGPLALKAVRQQMLDDDAKLSRKYINDHCARIKRMFRWAAAEEMVPVTVPQALSMVDGLRKGRTTAKETQPVAPVDDATVEMTIGQLPQVIADMVRLQRLAGIRPAEVCKLRPSDLDRSCDAWVYQPDEHKTAYRGKARTVFIGPKGQAILLRYLARDQQAYCFSPRGARSRLWLGLASESATAPQAISSCENR